MTTSVEYPFRITGVVGLAACVFGVRSGRARAVVSDGTVAVRYGRRLVETPLSNIRDVGASRPYRIWKVAGPPHLSLSDAGLTFAMNRQRNVCLTSDEPVPGLLPYGLLAHPSLTFTVAFPDHFADLVCGAGGGRLGVASNSAASAFH